jgi:hypothetical protein
MNVHKTGDDPSSLSVKDGNPLGSGQGLSAGQGSDAPLLHQNGAIEKAAGGGVIDTGVANQTAVHRGSPSEKMNAMVQSIFHPLIIANFSILFNRVSKKT